MATVLCSTGALIGRPNGRDYRLLKLIAPKLNCDGFEFMMYSTWYEQVDELLEFLKDLKLNIPVVHCEKAIGKSISIGDDENLNDAFRRFKINCRIANELGAKKLVLHLWDGVPSDSNFDNNIKAYPKLAEIAKRHELSLLVENVVCNRFDPMTHWIELVKLYPDVKFVFDTKMAEFHSQLQFIYNQDYSFLHENKHILHYHVNDYGGGHMDWENLKTLPIGKGNINFDQFFQHIKNIGYFDTFTVESTAFNSQGEVDIEMLNQQFEIIRDYLK